jgi:hypothetical protein
VRFGGIPAGGSEAQQQVLADATLVLQVQVFPSLFGSQWKIRKGSLVANLNSGPNQIQ